MCRPFGENAGLSFVPTPSVIVFGLARCHVVDLDVETGPELAVYAISLEGAGDQVARSAHDSPKVRRLRLSLRRPSPRSGANRFGPI